VLVLVLVLVVFVQCDDCMKGTRYDDLCEVGLREFGYAPCMSVWMCLLSVCPGSFVCCVGVFFVCTRNRLFFFP